MGLKWECPADQTCSTWALSYFMDCICSQWDTVSFVLGIASIVCWAVAEIPQIVVNWRSGHVEGVSMAFIFAWMMGDLCNLVGCWIDPGTLPTQLYLALLYVVTTLLLVGKQIWSTWTAYRDSPKWPAAEPLLGSRTPRRPSDLEGTYSSDTGLLLSHTSATQSLPVMNKGGRPLIHVSASLPVQPYFREPGIYPGSMPVQPVTRCASTYSLSWRLPTLSNSFSASATGSPMLHRGVIFSSLVVVGVTFIVLSPLDGRQGLKQGVLSVVGSGKRQLLMKDEVHDIEQSVGICLGWIMTCIYLTGRLPQLILNWSRDFVIGVSVPTVVFAFLGNATYLGSILVRGVEWRKLKPVLPWVIDVICCIVMDIIMTLQYLIRHRKDGQIILE